MVIGVQQWLGLGSGLANERYQFEKGVKEIELSHDGG